MTTFTDCLIIGGYLTPQESENTRKMMGELLGVPTIGDDADLVVSHKVILSLGSYNYDLELLAAAGAEFRDMKRLENKGT